MRPEVEQELAHTLLVELLAYQFASPVRWIETQDVILGEKTTERIVEDWSQQTLWVEWQSGLSQPSMRHMTLQDPYNDKSFATTRTQKTSITMLIRVDDRAG